MRLRGLILGLAALGLLAAPIQAQHAFGFNAGATYASLDGFDADSDSKWGFLGGVRYEWINSRYLSIPIELNFVQKGGQGNVDVSGDDVFVEVTNNFVEIPILLNITYPAGTSGRFGFYSGIELGFNVGCTVEGNSGDSMDCGDGSLQLDPQGFNYSWPFGIEYLHQLNSGHRIGFDVRYSLGISNAVESSWVNFKNKAWYFTGRWMLPARL
jgi:hypothetical protein